MTDPIAIRDLTTLRVGGVPRAMVAPATEAELVAAAVEVWAHDDTWMLLGGGSNTLASDEEFDGTVIRLVTRGIEVLGVDAGGAADAGAAAGDRIRLRVRPVK